jgi:hypothetical protein
MWRVRALVIWLNVAVLCALAPLTWASPPDPTYVAGFWDNDDYDDVIILATSTIGSIDTHPTSHLTRLLVVVALVLPGEDELLPAALLSPHPPRAPPAV